MTKKTTHLGEPTVVPEEARDPLIEALTVRAAELVEENFNLRNELNLMQRLVGYLRRQLDAKRSKK